jgi:hypothetical protein
MPTVVTSVDNCSTALASSALLPFLVCWSEVVVILNETFLHRYSLLASQSITHISLINLDTAVFIVQLG